MICDFDVNQQETQLLLTNHTMRLERSVKVTKHGTIQYFSDGFLLVCYSNFVHKTHHFFPDIRLKKCSDCEKWVRGPSRPLEMSHLTECIRLPIDVL